MGRSWSGVRKQLEQEYLCESLKGKIQFFVTRYSKTSDVHTRVAIRFDREEVLKSDFIKWRRASEESFQNDIETHNRGGFDSAEFYGAFCTYQNQNVQKTCYAMTRL